MVKKRPRPKPARHLRTPQAAEWLGISPRTLERYRTLGCGPVFHKLGNRVTYTLADLKDWVENGISKSIFSKNYILMRSGVTRRGRRPS
ncbi:helix-turn-helix domain-containing protein [Gluconacetobacter azotocaptans]|uniref:Helix-turn-helix domain-containing protein n=2 Tax=Gluconacetobacter sacchari TaxID=92759 RepID=A0A7W4IDD0_9PROT|nr:MULTISPECIES: helix-turn-helix domain-containing protein [Gluconacetobacter]MBB2160687.1 helix-turn-helix domain-containing protein [Gluconacetobacter sacchari]MBM9400803.1 helix-turn-helix domain-containing protein [Gluconacetobacter azotocaptans]GBQ19642.1 putative transcriptional regulator [Gluconacetobacter sacchari DSM 12717]